MADSVTAPEELITPSNTVPKKTKPAKGTSPRQLPPSPFNLPPAVPVFEERDGLRKVKPYMFEFQSYAKERWQNRTLLDVYKGWVRDRSAEYYAWAIETGAIVVNNQKATADTILKNGDLISNVLHRHEPPVVAGPIKIIYDGRLPGNDGETLVVEKPGSMPVHATGRYNFNTLLSILKYDYDIPLVHTSNRLDRLTSGVMVCALTVEASKKLGAWFGGKRAAEGGVSKEYVARCIGCFPEEEVICEEPLLTIDRQIGVNVVHPEGRHAKTIFNRMSYDERSNTSVIHCKPITGRTHQIRVHLQYLGHPIANDPIYQNTSAWGPELGKGGVFGEDRGGTNEHRQARHDAGDKLMERLKAEGRSASYSPASSNPDSEQENEVDDVATKLATQSIGPDRQFQQSGNRVRAPPTAEELDAVEADRKSHDPALTDKARVVVAVLRDVKDEADGWARQRDLRGIEKAKESASGGLLNASEKVAKGEQLPDDEDKDQGFESWDDGQGKFCPVCYVPVIPDPRPDQLFIWLHAMRYKTTEWDWSSPLPYWAEADYEVPSLPDYSRC